MPRAALDLEAGLLAAPPQRRGSVVTSVADVAVERGAWPTGHGDDESSTRAMNAAAARRNRAGSSTCSSTSLQTATSAQPSISGGTSVAWSAGRSGRTARPGPFARHGGSLRRSARARRARLPAIARRAMRGGRPVRCRCRGRVRGAGPFDGRGDELSPVRLGGIVARRVRVLDPSADSQSSTARRSRVRSEEQVGGRRRDRRRRGRARCGSVLGVAVSRRRSCARPPVARPRCPASGRRR